MSNQPTPAAGSNNPQQQWWGAGSADGGQSSWMSKYFAYSDPIEDGSQVMTHDGWDVQDANFATSPYTELGRVVAGLSQQLFGAASLGNDIFWGFNKRVPDPTPLVPLRSAYEPHQQLVESILATPEYQTIHANTQGDDYLARLATVGTLREAVSALGPETLERINRLQRLSKISQEADDQASTLEEIAELLRKRGQLERAQELLDMAARLRQQQMDCESQIQGDQTALSEDELDAMRRGALAGMQGVQGQVEAAAAGFNLFGPMMNMNGPGGGTSAGKSGMDTETKMKLAKRLMQSEKIRLLAEMAGRFIDIAIRAQYAKLHTFQTEVTDIKLGQTMPRVLPSELALLSGNHPSLKRLFRLRFAEEELMEYEIESREPQGRGPLIVAIDDSGSMTGQPELWSKACALALMKIAARQKRDCVIVHFTTSVDRIDEFPRNKPISLDSLLATLEYFSGGGTAFEPWMTDALARVEKSQFEKADVICITDGLAYVPDEFEKKWNTAREARGMRAYCILISDYDQDDGAKQMARLCDSLMTISPKETNLDGSGDDLDILNQIFSV